MRHELNTSEDLDYLAGIGFEAVQTSDSDLKELKVKIRQRVSPNWSGFTGTAALTALFLSVNLFFAFYNREVIWPSYPDNKLSAVSLLKPEDSLSLTQLDEVSVSPEKFRYIDKGTVASSDVSERDTIQVLSLSSHKSFDSLKHLNESESLRTVINSEITYIHDLKVSNYRSLYFKRKTNRDLSGLPAAYSYEETTKEGPALKEQAEIFLHEQLAEALFYFKKGRYDDCIRLFYEIQPYNQNDINCNFYLGMCFYYKANYGRALRYFEECFNPLNNAFAEEALFYKASCLYETGNAEAAMALFQQISSGNGFYGARATAFLKQ